MKRSAPHRESELVLRMWEEAMLEERQRHFSAASPVRFPQGVVLEAVA